MQLKAVLFDLDGTLVDSAPDLAAAGNTLRESRGLPPLPAAQFRPMTSQGARGMVGIALGLTPDNPDFEAAKADFLASYAQRLTALTDVFTAMKPVIDRLDEAGFPWGIVTNKASRFTDPIVAALGLAERAQVVISGDTTPHAKPHPAPLLEAARRLGLPPSACLYAGDDLRDVQAGQAAGMQTVAVAWGYLGQDEPIDQWGADHCIEHPHELLNLLPLP
ncbi:MAG: phosphoglycolate phosphatase [Burkholderiales bacterium]